MNVVEDAVDNKMEYRTEVQMKGDSRKRERITAPSQHRLCETSPRPLRTLFSCVPVQRPGQ